MQHPISVICDQCRATGEAGTGAFAQSEALADILAFDPVPRKLKRVDGWDAETQRAFIAALAATGSARRAAEAAGRAPWGADQLRKAPGAAGFAAAWDAALALYKERDRLRLAGNFAIVAKTAGRPAPPLQPWHRALSRRDQSPAAPPAAARDAATAPVPGQPSEETIEALGRLLRLYTIKLTAERKARLAGQVVAADLYVRQLTWLEAALDMLSGNGAELLAKFRRGEFHIVNIAATPLSTALDAARRRHWAAIGEPLGPEHPPADLLAHHDGFSSEPQEFTRSRQPLSHDEQRRAFEARHAEAAAAQIAWEAQAREDSRQWRERLRAEAEAEAETEVEAETEAEANAAGDHPQPAPPDPAPDS